MIAVELVGAQRVVAFLEALPNRTIKSVRDEVNRLGVELRDKVVGEKLQGQVLNVKTGTLQRSINFKMTEDGGNFVGSVGTNIVYARIHEFGGTIQMKLREHTLRWRADAKGNRTSNKFAPARLKRVATQKVTIGAHQIVMPERSFMRSSLREKSPEIYERLAKALQVVNKGGR